MRKQYFSLLTKRVASLSFIEGSSPSDPVQARCRVTSKNCVQKEYVLAYVWPNMLLCHFNVPDAILLSVRFWLRTKEEVMRLYACVVAEKDEAVCVVTNRQLSSLLGDQHPLKHDVPHRCSSSTLH